LIIAGQCKRPYGDSIARIGTETRPAATARELHGSVSAEHGVGRLKRDEFTYYKSPVEIELMQILALKSYLRRVILAPG
jgi:hypothetical protein